MRPGIIRQPGYQGSETTWVEITLYQHGDDPVILTPGGGGKQELIGKRPSDPHHSIISCSVSKGLGSAAGQWQFTLKPSYSAPDILNWMVDDDWVDIVFYRHDQPWHVMRGLIDRITRNRVTSKTGATTVTYTIQGQEWSKIFEKTPVWFSPYADADLVTDAVAHRVMDSLPQVVKSPPEAVEAYLRGFLEELSTSAGVNWNPPKGMPGILDDSFLKSVAFHSKYFQHKPPREAFNPNHLQPQGTLWSLAQQFSDPLFTEFYADILPGGDPFSQRLVTGDPMAPGEGIMSIIVRDKPFPVVDSGVDFTSWWDQVPVSIVARQEIVSDTVGKSGEERFNAYFVAPLLHQESLGQHAITILAPMVDLKDIQRHGMRRMDIQSQQKPSVKDLDYGTMSDHQRRILRDWYALNPYFISGTINLGIGRPDLKIGTRIRIPGFAVNQSDDETYYVEQVMHDYVFGRGTKTKLGVTRGWIGSDASYLESLEKMSSRYVVPKRRKDA